MYMIVLLLLIMFILFKSSNSFINFLITMEYFILTMIIIILMNNLNNWIFILYMIFAVCESILGLSLLVSMNFNMGHQNINFMNLCLN